MKEGSKVIILNPSHPNNSHINNPNNSHTSRNQLVPFLPGHIPNPHRHLPRSICNTRRCLLQVDLLHRWSCRILRQQSAPLLLLPPSLQRRPNTCRDPKSLASLVLRPTRPEHQAHQWHQLLQLGLVGVEQPLTQRTTSRRPQSPIFLRQPINSKQPGDKSLGTRDKRFRFWVSFTAMLRLLLNFGLLAPLSFSIACSVRYNVVNWTDMM